MLYSEFIEGTGCKDNNYNYQVYLNLDQMYMNTDMTKNQVYEYGKKLVDNSKTPEEIETEKKLKSELQELKNDIRYYQERMDIYNRFYKEDGNPEWKTSIQNYRKEIKRLRIQIKNIKFILSV